VEIAEQFGISPDTLYEWQAAHPEFSEALQNGKTPADAEMAASFYKRGLGYEHPAVKIFQGTADGGPVIVPYLEHIPGDVGAQKSWLYNRQPERWRDQKQVEHMGSLEHRISLMTPEERIARLRELQEKARLAIEGSASEVEEDRTPPNKS